MEQVKVGVDHRQGDNRTGRGSGVARCRLVYERESGRAI